MVKTHTSQAISKKTALFLGAGASKTLGYPLTKELLPQIIKRINSTTLFTKTRHGKDVEELYRILIKELILSLSPGLLQYFTQQENIDFESPLVTDLLSQIENIYYSGQGLVDWNFDIKLKGMLGSQDALNKFWDTRDIITLFEWAIINTIYSIGRSNGKKLNPDITTKIEQMIKSFKTRNGRPKSYVTIITTNYDTSIELNLLKDKDDKLAYNIIDYGFDWRDPWAEQSVIHKRPENPNFKIFKLHGSTDWLKCDRCGHIYINATTDLYTLAFNKTKTDANSCHCDYWPLKPVLVTPSYVRNTKDTNLMQIWRNTYEELRLADEWVIAGYSLPNEDLDIKSLFLRALKGRKDHEWPKIKVYQNSLYAKPKYDAFFGKDKYEYFDTGFINYDPIQ